MKCVYRLTELLCDSERFRQTCGIALLEALRTAVAELLEKPPEPRIEYPQETGLRILNILDQSDANQTPGSPGSSKTGSTFRIALKQQLALERLIRLVGMRPNTVNAADLLLELKTRNEDSHLAGLLLSNYLLNMIVQ